MSLADLLERPAIKPEEIETYLDGLTPFDRVRETTALNRGQQERLWEVAGTWDRKIDLDYLVPKDAEPFAAVPFEGKNSLPAFTRFRKVFYRTPDGAVAGYNNQAIEKVTGPGYFVVDPSPGAPGETVVNYLKVPAEKPAGWPEIRRNEEGLSQFIYANTNDFLRYVSGDVAIGRAFKVKGEKIVPMPNWFVLCRQG